MFCRAVVTLVALPLFWLAGCSGDAQDSKVSGSDPPSSVSDHDTLESNVIIIDPDVFSFLEEEGYSLETFAVTGDIDTAKVAQVLDSAANRFMLVDEQGVVHPTLESMEAAGAISAASYVSDAEVTDQGVEVYIDCQGSIEDSVAAAFKSILVEVLKPVVAEARVVAVRVDEGDE